MSIREILIDRARACSTVIECGFRGDLLDVTGPTRVVADNARVVRVLKAARDESAALPSEWGEVDPQALSGVLLHARDGREVVDHYVATGMSAFAAFRFDHMRRPSADFVEVLKAASYDWAVTFPLGAGLVRRFLGHDLHLQRHDDEILITKTVQAADPTASAVVDAALVPADEVMWAAQWAALLGGFPESIAKLLSQEPSAACAALVAGLDVEAGCARLPVAALVVEDAEALLAGGALANARCLEFPAAPLVLVEKKGDSAPTATAIVQLGGRSEVAAVPDDVVRQDPKSGGWRAGPFWTWDVAVVQKLEAPLPVELIEKRRAPWALVSGFGEAVDKFELGAELVHLLWYPPRPEPDPYDDYLPSEYDMPGGAETEMLLQFVGTRVSLRFLLSLEYGGADVVSWVVDTGIELDTPITTVEAADQLMWGEGTRDFHAEIQAILRKGTSAHPSVRLLPSEWLHFWGGGEVPAGVLDPDEPVVFRMMGWNFGHVGVQQPDRHEYFVPSWGTLLFELSGDKWTARLASERMPLVLSPEVVAAGWMPPGGQSALPGGLAEVVPPEYRYWDQVDQVNAAKATRDALVLSGFFSEENLGIVDGGLRRFDLSQALYKAGTDWTPGTVRAAPPPPPAADGDEDVRFAVLKQTYRGQVPAAAGPLDEMYYLIVKRRTAPGARVDAWAATADPRSTPATGWRVPAVPPDFLEFEGDWAPGEGLNPSPDATAKIECLDRGAAVPEAGGFELRGREGRVRVAVDLLDPLAEGWSLAPVAAPTPESSGRDQVRKQIAFIEKRAEEQFVLGVVLEPNDGEDGNPLDPDTHNDIYSVDEVRGAAHRWLADYRHTGLMHTFDVSDSVEVVESYLAPMDLEIEGQAVRKGTWLLGLKILDLALWQEIKDGVLNGLSAGLTAYRDPA